MANNLAAAVNLLIGNPAFLSGVFYWPAIIERRSLEGSYWKVVTESRGRLTAVQSPELWSAGVITLDPREITAIKTGSIGGVFLY